MAKVELKNICKVYEGGVKAVDDQTITIEDKEFVVFVGPSGCGKSTTLRMVAGLEEITSGDLFIDGTRMNDVPPKDRNIAMVFQNYALYPHMTVYNNMAFGLKIRKFPKEEIDKRVREAAKILDIEQYLDRKPKALSGGQRQRVAMGRAIVRNPKVFLFDEPLSNLDAKLRAQMRVEIAALHQRLDATIIYVTHDQIEAMTLGDKIVVMKAGRVQQIGSPLALYNEPVNKFVAGFIGSPQMNFMDLKVTEKDGGVFVGGEGFELKAAAKDIEKLKAYKHCVGETITFGIRPEDLSLAPDDATENVIPMNISVIEPLGSETHLSLKRDGVSVLAKVAPDAGMRIGDARKVVPNMEKARFFDISTEVRV